MRTTSGNRSRARISWRHALVVLAAAAGWITGCQQIIGLDGPEYVDEICGEDAECDDANPCTADTCGEGHSCLHEPGPDGVFPDAEPGNCMAFACKGGVPAQAEAPDDTDDKNPCTQDACDGATPSHTPLPGAPCTFHDLPSACDEQGQCLAPECGNIGAGGQEVTCPPGPDDCSVSSCVSGQCLLDELDGVPVPGGEPPTECTGQYCVDGAETTVHADPGTPCTQAGGDPGKCDGAGECMECVVKADCDTGLPESPCHAFDCVNGVCAQMTQPDGPLPDQVAGDCHLRTCTGGLYSDQVDDLDVPVDGFECTQDVCTNGSPSNPPAAPNSPCGEGGLLFCDGSGACLGCLTDDQCPGGTACKTPFCDPANDECTFQFPNAGTVIAAQAPGDCKTLVCDGNGNITSQLTTSDPQDDGNDCTQDTCLAMDMTSHTPLAKGSACDDGGGVVCDAAAHCVGAPCSMSSQCPGGTACVDGVCCESSCNGTCNACSAAKKGSGPNGLCGPILAGDPDNECVGGTVCSAGSCNKLPNGQPCMQSTECSSSICGGDGVCCNTFCFGTCQACDVAGSVGTCTNVPSGQDPDNECAGTQVCNGSGQCRRVNGDNCSGNNDCLSGDCEDDVCCATPCNGTCASCALPGNLGVCTFVPSGTDPDNECGAPFPFCDGAGTCGP